MTASPSRALTAPWLVVAFAGLVGLSLLLAPAAEALQPQPVEDPVDACPDDENPASPFDDRDAIPDVHVLNVDCAFNNDITVGFTDNTFRPRTPVRRDQFASFLVRTMRAGDVDLPAADDQGFEDIQGNPHEDNINILAETGITQGFTGTRYGPREFMPRDQIGSFVLRAAAFIEDVSLESLQRDDGPFTDVPEGNVHEENINGARHFNLTVGRTSSTYEPASLTRRDQMASFLIRLLASLRADGGLIEPTERVTDITFDDEDLDATNRVGTDHTASATVTDRAGDPVEDANVRFEVYRDDDQTADGSFRGPVESDTISTDADGRVSFTYTGPDAAAIDTIVACTATQDGTCGVEDEDPDTAGTQFTGEPTVQSPAHATARKTWIPNVDDIAFDDDDVDATNVPTTAHSVTVTASRDGEPVEDATIRFEIYRDDAETEAGTFSGPVESEQVTTDADGRATFSYTGPSEPAEDVIVSCTPTKQGTCGVADEDPDTEGTQFTGESTVDAHASATARKSWERGPLAFANAKAINAPAETHTVTVTLEDESGDPVDNTDVRFEVYRGALEPLSDVGSTDFSGPVEEGTDTTDVNGQATFSYTGPGERARDLIVACVPEGADTCDVADEDPDTAGIQFTGGPDVGAEIHAVAIKLWTFEANSASAGAFGAHVSVLGGNLLGGVLDEPLEIGPLPEVDVTLPEDGRQAEENDDLLALDLGSVGRAGLTEVAAAGDLDAGHAGGNAETADVALLGDEDTGEPLITADAIQTESTSTCTGVDEVTTETDARFVNLTIGGTEVPVNPGTNFSVTLDGVAEVTVNKVIETTNERGEEETVVQGLYINLLDDTGEITVAEARSALDCGEAG